MYFPDFSNECQLATGADVRAIGWLNNNYSYKTGNVSLEFLQKLNQHITEAWEPVVAAGVHSCEFCKTNRFSNGSNLLIPTCILSSAIR